MISLNSVGCRLTAVLHSSTLRDARAISAASPPESCKRGEQCGTIANAENANIEGKICDTTSLLPNTSGPSMFGACN